MKNLTFWEKKSQNSDIKEILALILFHKSHLIATSYVVYIY